MNLRPATAGPANAGVDPSVDAEVLHTKPGILDRVKRGGL